MGIKCSKGRFGAMILFAECIECPMIEGSGSTIDREKGREGSGGGLGERSPTF